MKDAQQQSKHSQQVWPALPYSQWKETCDTLHMWTQIVGKTRLQLTPLENHWWNVPLYVSAHGLSTSPIPYDKSASDRIFEAEFDFLVHKLKLRTSEGREREVGLYPRSVSNFYAEYSSAMNALGIELRIHTMPVEFANPIPFEQDHTHAAYDPEYVLKFWHILLSTDCILKEFRSRFIGKCSPVHFFWGSFDIAVTRFSGRAAPERKDADAVTREAYSHEVSSCGWWPGDERFPEAAFYAYFSPAPSGLENGIVRPKSAFYSQQLGEFILKHADLIRETSPKQALLEFCQSTYEAGAELSNWDRLGLERAS